MKPRETMSLDGQRVQLPPPQEREAELRAAMVPVGFWVSAIVSTGVAVYALLTWSDPNRDLILLMSALGLLSAAAVRLAPIERIVRSRWREAFFLSWTAATIALVATITALDGGTASPYALLFALPVIFASVSYPLRSTVVIGGFAVVAYLIAAISTGDTLAVSIAGAFALLAAAWLCAWISQEQATRRSNLAGTAEALEETESTTRLLAAQQRQVASLGQLALEGADVDRLCEEAVSIISTVLDAEITAVLKHLPDEDNFIVRNAVGLPDEAIGVVIPSIRTSQAGYTMTTGEATVVSDWSKETRFEQSEVLRRARAVSGINTLIRAKGRPYGVLGVQTSTRREFTQEDIDFVQSIANVLANAIERWNAEERTRHDALHDPLTDLPNRTLFLDRLGQALTRSARRRSSVAVLFMDMDQFKLVNDSLGHEAGDELLQAVGRRFREVLRPGDTVARFGGDEFALLVEDVDSGHGATRLAERIAQSLTRPFVLRRREHFVSVSVGIAIGHGEEKPEALLRDADAALYRAKEQGRGRYEIFDSVLRARVIEHMEIENDLRRALDRSEMELRYQPVVSLADGSVTALEALLRWRHPDRGVLAPEAFLSAAENSQLIVPIGRSVIAEACLAASGWQELDPDSAPIRISINLSAGQLMDPQLPEVLERAIESSGIEPVTLDLEMTESALLEESEAPDRRIRRLKEIGVRLILDDFGTGFSSLGYLRRLPFDAIKLDRSFVEDLGDGSPNAAMVRAMVDMAKALELEVVAEGVENPEQLEAVRRLGCAHVQGFYFSAPLPPDAVEGLLLDPPWRAVEPDRAGAPPSAEAG